MIMADRWQEDALRREIVRFGAMLWERQLAHGSTGNLSARLDDGTILMTPTNASLGALEAAQLSRLSADGARLSGPPPSKEAFLHLAVYDERPSARAVVHLHATYSAALSCLCHANRRNVLPPLTAYQIMRVGRLPLIPYHRPGDLGLAEAVRAEAGQHQAMLLANHGPVIAGTTLEQAVFAAMELEETAKLFFIIGDRPQALLTCEAVEGLEAAFPAAR